ncbi:hypothetical protein LCGC14_2987030, partial [marine sediment metagenome]
TRTKPGGSDRAAMRNGAAPATTSRGVRAAYRGGRALDVDDVTDVCVLGADHPDATSVMWALRVLGATVSTEPCEAQIRVLFGSLDDDRYDGASTIFVPTSEDLDNLDPQRLDRPGLWVVPTIVRAQRLTALATRELRVLVLPWSHPAPVRDTPLVIEDGPVVARGPRGATGFCFLLPRLTPLSSASWSRANFTGLRAPNPGICLSASNDSSGSFESTFFSRRPRGYGFFDANAWANAERRDIASRSSKSWESSPCGKTRTSLYCSEVECQWTKSKRSRRRRIGRSCWP